MQAIEKAWDWSKIGHGDPKEKEKNGKQGKWRDKSYIRYYSGHRLNFYLLFLH